MVNLLKKKIAMNDMIKNIMAFVLAGVLCLSCSSIVDEVDNKPLEESVTLKATVSLGANERLKNHPQTKSVDEHGIKAFVVGDEIAVIYKNSSNQTIKAKSNQLKDNDISPDGKHASFTITLTDPAVGDVEYIYPASMANNDGTINLGSLNYQDGTLSSLSNSKDCAKGEGELKYEGTSYSFSSNVILSNLFVIGKFTIKDNNNNNDITATITSLKVNDGVYEYNIDREASEGPIYLALLPVSDDKSISFTAFNGTKNYYKTVKGKTLVAGSMYPITIKMQPEITTISESRLINMDPNIGDFSILGKTYYRMLIGTDSEGWCYVAQRKYSNLSTDANVNIYRTKDFSNYELFKTNSCGHQLIELENGELCFATHEVEKESGVDYIKCNVYVTINNKAGFEKKFSCTQISQYSPASPWSWGIQARGHLVAVSEYGTHGQCGKVWYSRDYGEHFYEVFDLRDKAPDVPHAHVHGICIDPYYDRLYVINGDGSPASTPALLHKNPRIWYWDYNEEPLSDNLKNTISWKYIAVGEEAGAQFVNGYALKNCVLLFTDGSKNGIFRIGRTSKSEIPVVEEALDLGVETEYTKFCGGNMFRRDEDSPLLICGIREYSCDLDPGTSGNPSNKPNTYKDVLSRVYSTYDGEHFKELWVDNTWGTYAVHYSGGLSEERNLAKCGRDMSVYQLPNGNVLLKYIGRDFGYVAYDNNGVTSTKAAYVPFCNEVVEFIAK